MGSFLLLKTTLTRKIPIRKTKKDTDVRLTKEEDFSTTKQKVATSVILAPHPLPLLETTKTIMMITTLLPSDTTLIVIEDRCNLLRTHLRPFILLLQLLLSLSLSLSLNLRPSLSITYLLPLPVRLLTAINLAPLHLHLSKTVISRL
jgi:hypothetical protein